MKKIVKYSLGCGCVGSLVVTILFFVAFCILVDGHYEGQPISVEYHTADDLYRISNVKFPEVCLVDSYYYECYMYTRTTEKFILKNPKDKTNLIAEIKKVMQAEPKYWTELSDSMIYYILPEMPINRTAGTGWRLTADGVEAHDGEEMWMVIPLNNDTITLVYGWAS